MIYFGKEYINGTVSREIIHFSYKSAEKIISTFV